MEKERSFTLPSVTVLDSNRSQHLILAQIRFLVTDAVVAIHTMIIGVTTGEEYLYPNKNITISLRPILPLAETKIAPCDHLEGWDGEGGREGDARGKRNGNILYMYN